MPVALTEALPVISASLEKELSSAQSLAWKYTAVLERLMDPDCGSADCDVPAVLLKQALYNIRQHEGFLRMLQVRKKISPLRSLYAFLCFGFHPSTMKSTVCDPLCVTHSAIFNLAHGRPPF